MNAMSTMRKDFVATHLRSQVSRLNNVLDVIGEEDKVNHDYAYESLKEIEASLRQIRKLCGNN